MTAHDQGEDSADRNPSRKPYYKKETLLPDQSCTSKEQKLAVQETVVYKHQGYMGGDARETVAKREQKETTIVLRDIILNTAPY